VAFGSALHASGHDDAALERTLRAAAAPRGLALTRQDTSLEDVFIYLMSQSKDNYGER